MSKQITGLDTQAMERARAHQSELLKPAGSLGRLEDIAVQMAGITGKDFPSVNKKIVYLFGSDNGVYEENISSAPQETTRELMLCYAASQRCGINVICEQEHVELRLVDIGVKGKALHPKIDDRNQMPEGTRNFAKGIPAMPIPLVVKAIEIGMAYAFEAHREQYDLLGTGEVGMGNTTTAAACILAALGSREVDAAVGYGAGLDAAAYAHKKEIIRFALNHFHPNMYDSIGILSAMGGLDIAALVGLYLGAAYCRIPIVIDGVISIAAALLAYRLQPLAREYMVPSHISEEPGYALAAKELRLQPPLDLRMRLGEGTGCPIVMHMIELALSVHKQMMTYRDVATIINGGV